MGDVAAFYAAHPFWVWMGVTAALLAVEAAVGTQWLLWPAVSAGVMALVTLLRLPIGPMGEVALFAGLTLVTTVTCRRLLVRVQPGGDDINDRSTRLIGVGGDVVAPFVEGRGRVFVDGAEWPAELEGEAGSGARIVVTAVKGASLKVRFS
ncbi:MAG: NfeD family protein [Caulobacteraceae bacterium]